METVRKDIFGVDEVETPKGLNQIVNKISSDVSIDTFSASIQARWNFGNSPGSRPYYETLTAFSGDIIFFDGSFVATGDATYESNITPRWVDSWGVEYDDPTDTLKIFSKTAEFVVTDVLQNSNVSFRRDVARSGFQLAVRQNIQIATGRNWYLRKGSYISLYLR